MEVEISGEEDIMDAVEKNKRTNVSVCAYTTRDLHDETFGLIQFKETQ